MIHVIHNFKKVSLIISYSTYFFCKKIDYIKKVIRKNVQYSIGNYENLKCLLNLKKWKSSKKEYK